MNIETLIKENTEALKELTITLKASNLSVAKKPASKKTTIKKSTIKEVADILEAEKPEPTEEKPEPTEEKPAEKPAEPTEEAVSHSDLRIEIQAKMKQASPKEKAVIKAKFQELLKSHYVNKLTSLNPEATKEVFEEVKGY